MEPEKRIAEIYSILKAGYGADGRFSDERAMDGVNQYNEIKAEDQHIPDYYFIANLCYGPWRDKRQKDVWLKAYERFKTLCRGDLTLLDSSTDLGFPFSWMRGRVGKMASFLRDSGMSFSEFLKSLEGKNGLEVRDDFKRILAAAGNKTLSCFVRDYLSLDVFPIDRRVSRMLTYLGLPKEEDKIVELCKAAGVNPKELDRMLYTYYNEKCARRGRDNGCSECQLARLCQYREQVLHKET